jgi:branched-subunit amino acid transport protein AzlD
MNYNIIYFIGAVLAASLVTYLTRVTPFIFFSHNRQPKIISFFEKYIPPIIMTILVIYSLTSVSFTKAPYGVAEITGILVVSLTYIILKNPLVSILGGTVLYMILIQSSYFGII